MPYDFGDWGGIGETIGARLAGKMTKSERDEKRMSDIMAMKADETSYQREQDRIKNFALFGGQDPELVMRGSRQAAAGITPSSGLMEDPNLVSLQAKAMPGAFDKTADNAFKKYQEYLGKKIGPKGYNVKDLRPDARARILRELQFKEKQGENLTEDEIYTRDQIIAADKELGGIKPNPERKPAAAVPEPKKEESGFSFYNPFKNLFNNPEPKKTYTPEQMAYRKKLGLE